MAKKGLIHAIFIALALTYTGGSSPSSKARVATAAAVQSLTTRPLYRFRNSKGYLYYSVNRTLPQGSTGDFILDGVICHVPGPNHQVPAVALRQYTKSDEYGERYLYAKSISVGGWADTGIAFYVATMKTMGAVPLYQLYKPFAPKPSQDWMDKFNEAVWGVDKKYPYVSKQDSFYYTPDEQDKNSAVQAGYQYQGIVGYVWLAPYPPAPAPLPDLAVQKVFNKEDSVQAIVVNQGKHSVSSVPGVTVRFLVTDKTGKVALKTEQNIGGMSSGQWRPVNFDTRKLTTTLGLHYQIIVDPSDVVEESDNSNNSSGDQYWGLKIKNDPDAAARVPAPSLVLAHRWGEGGPKIAYRLSVTNWSAYKPELFQTLNGVLPADKYCKSNERMVARVSAASGGGLISIACFSLSSPKSLEELVFTRDTPLADTDRLQLVLEDRLTGNQYLSNTYAVGWFGLDKVLVPTGCKYFLGRAGDFLCNTDDGMKACENLRQKGKPIKCTRAGKPQ